jgi:hypothetical protein
MAMKFLIYAVTVCAVAAASPVSAAKYLLQATGTVEQIAIVDKGVVNLNPILTNNLVTIGDRIAFSFEFDTVLTSLSPTFDIDPTINIYSFVPQRISLAIGSYIYAPSSRAPNGSTVQLWNDHLVGSDAVDSQSFSVFDYPFSDNKPVYPFRIGAGNISESIGVSLFDRTATARSSDLISQIVDPSRFATKTFSYGLLNSTTDFFYNVTSNSMAISITAVPEPATWMMMLIGFGMVGGAARYRRRATKVTYAKSTNG